MLPKLLLSLGSLAATAVVATTNSPDKDLHRVTGPLERPALVTPRAARALMLGLAQAGERLVAVGERGVILLSDDAGNTWRQAKVPVSVTLTTVRFADASQGWAAGHNGVLLRSRDGGLTWQHVLNGHDVIGLYEKQAQALATQRGAGEAKADQARQFARQLATDGPDKPWLGLSVDAGDFWLVGAYGLALRSTDGERWEPWSHRLDNPRALHLYAVQTRGQEVVMAGEQGTLLRSTDGGQHFTRLNPSYKGSFFELQLGANEILVAGLKGQVFRSTDGGQHFEPIALNTQASISASLRRPDGSVLLADQGGGLHDIQGTRATRRTESAGPSPAALLLGADGRIYSAGSAGVLTPETTRQP